MHCHNSKEHAHLASSVLIDLHAVRNHEKYANSHSREVPGIVQTLLERGLKYNWQGNINGNCLQKSFRLPTRG